MSPFEQFINEQADLFQKQTINERLDDEENSVTLKTSASTNFDSKTFVSNPLTQFNSGSISDEPISVPKKMKLNLHAHNKLSHIAQTLTIDSKVKTIEDEIMLERKDSLRQLRTIKGYLTGIRTGFKSYAPRNSGTMMK
jgi:hypothetical protein